MPPQQPALFNLTLLKILAICYKPHTAKQIGDIVGIKGGIHRYVNMLVGLKLLEITGTVITRKRNANLFKTVTNGITVRFINGDAIIEWMTFEGKQEMRF